MKPNTAPQARRKHMYRHTNRNVALVLCSVVALSLSGCGGKTEQEETKAKVTGTTSDSAPKIEVVANMDAKEIKVKNKNKKW